MNLNIVQDIPIKFDDKYWNQITLLNYYLRRGKSTKIRPIEKIPKYLLKRIECLDVSYHDLKTLNLVRLINLRYIDCTNNYIRSLDFSSNLKLEMIYCGINYLDTLILGYKPYLKRINNRINFVEYLNLRDCPSLLILDNWGGHNLKLINCNNNLRYLCLSKINFDTISLDYKKLKILHIDDCDLNNFKLMNILHSCSLLRELSILWKVRGLSYIFFDKLPRLKKINLCVLDELEELNVNSLVCLESIRLYCSGSVSKLKSLDLSNLHFLKNVECPESIVLKFNEKYEFKSELLYNDNTKIYTKL